MTSFPTTVDTRSRTTKSIFPACSLSLDIESFRHTVGTRNSALYRAACRSQKQRTERRRQFALAQWPNQNANTRQRVSCCILNRFDSRFASSSFLSTFIRRRLVFTRKSRGFSRTVLELEKFTVLHEDRSFFFLSFSLFFFFYIRNWIVARFMRELFPVPEVSLSTESRIN